MIRLKRLPANIEQKLPELSKKLEAHEKVSSFYIFGSLATGNLRPLSDLDFAILLSKGIPKENFFEIELNLREVIESTLKTEEFDLVVLNSAPPGFSYNVLKTGKLLFCKDREQLINFRERVVKYYLDFRYFRDQFTSAFLEGIGYCGRKDR